MWSWSVCCDRSSAQLRVCSRVSSSSMGCGGSRADAIIEPRYQESCTRETESTWITNTDAAAQIPKDCSALKTRGVPAECGHPRTDRAKPAGRGAEVSRSGGRRTVDAGKQISSSSYQRRSWADQRSDSRSTALEDGAADSAETGKTSPRVEEKL